MHKPDCNCENHKKEIEILAPCGDFESVSAAVLNGANAVYLGQKSFSARQNAKNFDSDELRLAVSYCHARGVKVYQTLNTLVFDSQEKEVVETVKIACECGVDAMIIQDLAVLDICRKACPQMPLHASTQMTVHTVQGAKLLERLGFSRVVLAREMAFEEIKEICEKTQIETEVFVHGALCMSVSGQCYISAMIGGRSGNRGSCAGTCRLPFSVGSKEEYALSLKDLCLADEVKKLKDIGVTSLKIEGRMKRPEYVAAASDSYSKSAKGEEYDLENLHAVFSRSGFTKSYFEKRLDATAFGTRQKEDVTSATSSLLRTLQNSYKKEKSVIPLEMTLTMKENQPATLLGIDSDGNSATAVGNIPQSAINRPTTLESAKAALAKLGGTIFYLDKLDGEVEDGIMLPAAELNEMRRELAEELLKIREKIERIPFDEDALVFHRDEKDRHKNVGKQLSFWGRFSHFEQISLKELDFFEYIILSDYEVMKNAERLLEYKEKIIIELPRVMFGEEEKTTERQKRLYEMGFSHVYLQNIAQIEPAREIGYTLHGSCFLNCTNSRSAAFLSRLGLDSVTLSFEMGLRQATDIDAELERQLVIYGSLPLMLYRNCPVKARISCEKCGGKAEITDRMNKKFKIICAQKKYSELLNCNPLYMAERLDELKGIDAGILYFTHESQNEVENVIKNYKTGEKPIGEFTRGLYYRSV